MRFLLLDFAKYRILGGIVSWQVSILKEGRRPKAKGLDRSQRRRMILFSARQKTPPIFR
jgi:hypothetical protein